MANADRPRGLKHVGFLGGVPMNGGVRRYRKEASVILGLGDPVVITGSSSTKGTNNADAGGIALVTRASAASGTITGVAVGFFIDTGSVERGQHTKHMAAADTGYVMVVDHPHALFEIQEDSVGNNLVVGDVGEGVDITIGNANTTTGYSICEIDSSTSAAQIGNADQLRVLELVDRPDNVLGANAKWIVLINEHSYAAAQTMI